MNQFILIFKTLYRNSHSKIIGVGGKKKLSSSLTMILSLLPLILLLAAGVAFLTISISDVHVLASLISVLLMGGQIAVIFLSLYSVLNTLYSSSDISLLNSLPLKPTSIFLAKFVLSYLSVLETSSIFVFPMVLTSVITFNIVNGSIFYGIYPFIIVMMLLSPILPLFLIVLFSMPLNYIGTYLKGNSVIKSILSLLIYIILIMAYMVVIFYFNTSGFGQNGLIEISDSTLYTLSILAKVGYPNYVLVNYALGIDFLKNFFISIGITIGMIGLLILLSFLFYNRINKQKLESQSNSSFNKKNQYKQQNIVKSLMVRDLKLIFRNSYMMLTSFANLIIGPFIIVVMYFINGAKGAESEMSALMFELMNCGFLIMYSSIFVCGTNMLSMIAYTREGESFVISKTLPINPKDSILSKVLLSVLCCLVPIILFAILGMVLYKIDILQILAFVIMMTLMVIGTSCLHIYFDMKSGNIHWKSNTDLKQVSSKNTGTLLAVFCSIIPGLIMFAFGFLISILENQLGPVVIKLIYWLISIIISLIILLAGVLVLTKKGELVYAKIGEKEFIRSTPNNSIYSRKLK